MYEIEKGLRAVYNHIRFYGIRGFFRSCSVAFFEEKQANYKLFFLNGELGHIFLEYGVPSY